jgi:hypothetical protein
MGFSFPVSSRKGKSPASSAAATPVRTSSPRTFPKSEAKKVQKCKSFFKLGTPSEAELMRNFQSYTIELWEDSEGEADYATFSAGDVGDADEECEKEFLMEYKKNDMDRAADVVENTRGTHPRHDLCQTEAPVRKSGGQLGSLAAVQAQYQEELEQFAMLDAGTGPVSYELVFDAEDYIEDPAPVVTLDQAAVTEQFERLLSRSEPEKRPVSAISFGDYKALGFEVQDDSVMKTTLDRVLNRPCSAYNAPGCAYTDIRVALPKVGIDFLPGLEHLTRPMVRTVMVDAKPKAKKEVSDVVKKPLLPGEDFHPVSTNTKSVAKSSNDDLQAMDNVIDASHDLETDTDSENQHAVDLFVSPKPVFVYDAKSQRRVGYTALNQLL